MYLHVTPTIAIEASGPSQSVLGLCDGLVQIGSDVALYCLDWAPLNNPPSFYSAFMLAPRLPRRFGFSADMRDNLMKACASGRVSLVHSHGAWMMPSVYATAAARRGRIPLVVSPRGTLAPWALAQGTRFKPLIWTILQKRALLAAQCIHVTSEQEYLDVRELGFTQPIAIIPNSVRASSKQFPAITDSRTLLFLGRIAEGKGVDMLIEAWSRLAFKHKDWEVRLVGPKDTKYASKMENDSTARGLPRFHFVGAAYGEHKAREFSNAEVFVLPSSSENFGVAVAEALAEGVPVIVTEGAPWSELCTRQAGWWIEHNVDVLTSTLDKVMSYTKEYLALRGCNGRAWMEKEFSQSRTASDMNLLYEWLLFGGSAPKFVYRD